MANIGVPDWWRYEEKTDPLAVAIPVEAEAAAVKPSEPAVAECVTEPVVGSAVEPAVEPAVECAR